MPASTSPTAGTSRIWGQFYGELQFDSYRELGRQLMTAVAADAGPDVEKLFARWRS
jgi:hypothetical protein